MTVGRKDDCLLVCDYSALEERERERVADSRANDQSLQALACHVKRSLFLSELPPPRSVCVAFQAFTARLDAFFQNTHQVRPSTGLGLAHVAKVDDVALMFVSRAIVYFLTADVGKDAFGVARVLCNQPLHFGYWVRSAARIGVIESETHTEHVAADVASSCIRLENRRALMSASVEEIGGNDRHSPTVQVERTWRVALGYPGHTDHNGCLARPLIALACHVNCSVVRANPPKASGPSVSLDDGVCGDETKRAIVTQEAKCAPEEVGHKVRISV